MKKLFIIFLNAIAVQLSAQIHTINTVDGGVTITPKGISSGISDNPITTILGSEAYKNFTQFNSNSNTSIGYASMSLKVSGGFNTAIGALSQRGNTSNFSLNIGERNTSVGHFSLNRIENGESNTAVGHYSGHFIRSGNKNTFLGSYAGQFIAVGSGNVMIGSDVGGSIDYSNKLFIDNSNSNNPLIKGDFSTDELKINSKLRVGGTGDTPTATLQVDGNLAITSKIPLTSSQNNFNVAGKSVIRVSGGSPITLTGLAGGVDGMIVHIYTVNTNLDILELSGLSSSGNQFQLGDVPLSTLSLVANGSVSFIYDADSGVWRLISFKL